MTRERDYSWLKRVNCLYICRKIIHFARNLGYCALLVRKDISRMAKKHKSRRHGRLQVITLCISTSLVLILLGSVVFTVLTAHNLSSYVKENLTVTLMLAEDTGLSESKQMSKKLLKERFVSHTTFISPEQALKEHIQAMGADPTEFLGGNPFVGSIEMQLKADYANSDSLRWISKKLRSDHRITDIVYQKDLMDMVNENIRKISIVLLVLAGLLAFISFSLINNTVRLGIFARRFTIHTMKLVGASWSFIRWPFLKLALFEGISAAIIANTVLAGGFYAFYTFEPGILVVADYWVLGITAGSVFVFGLFLTAFCSWLSVNKFLRMKAGDLYKI